MKRIISGIQQVGIGVVKRRRGISLVQENVWYRYRSV